MYTRYRESVEVSVIAIRRDAGPLGKGRLTNPVSLLSQRRKTKLAYRMFGRCEHK